MSLKVGFALTGSFCTFDKVLPQMERLAEAGYEVIPIMSEYSYKTDTRFGSAENFRNRIIKITGHEIISTIVQAEPIGPQGMLNLMVIAPATGNTLAKIANGVNDTAVTMAAKATLRNHKPVILAASTNDGLGGSGRNLGQLLNTRNVFFVPMRQDDYIKKPSSIVAKFELILPTVEQALQGKQLQPVFLAPETAQQSE